MHTTSDDLYQATYACEQKTRGLQYSAVGTVNGCGYDDQQVDAIYDAHGPCQTIRSTLKPVFLPISSYNFLSCLDVQIWRF